MDPSLLCFSAHQKNTADRMMSNHFALNALFEGNTLPIIKKEVDFNSNTTKVLDIGCGPGSWVMDMATEYPNTHFIGIDQLPLFPQDIRPANVTFRQSDILAGLPFEDNSFDFIQMRLFLVAFNRTNWIDALNEVYRLLKPGGYVQLLEAQLMDEGDEVIEEYVAKIRTIMEFNDFDPEICDKLGILIEKSGFILKDFTKKSVPLQNHVLSEEFMYIVDISVESCKQFIMEINDMHTEDEWIQFKSIYIASRRLTDSVFTAAAGQKPT
ncbi:hypothetical protein G6F46_005733 [Rhizopus delemar]|uniref:Methyltransferase domain-containing protein n=2 Tax=Rhizopus TaxID=4842 RepID=A0A9P7CQL1_9FUNG|nr:hypothetical protein G6F55_004250 [Rhizopus delemar]KAG1544870.1 hypothetical protein G6F51_005802 [Rhizopus arrhizus]KAG1498523.1 hypothetical protein G6F54_005025 [Rhizopus delemar]KAG1512320.1 hypothetical protein G6F53_005271 [Rhizopus delemar]KAG1527164.1 hypothetical protein G6F52_001780 [Rhizopus delemar]